VLHLQFLKPFDSAQWCKKQNGRIYALSSHRFSQEDLRHRLSAGTIDARQLTHVQRYSGMLCFATEIDKSSFPTIHWCLAQDFQELNTSFEVFSRFKLVESIRFTSFSDWCSTAVTL